MQKGISPCVAIPAAMVTACCSAIPTSNARSGCAAIIYLRELPVGIAGVMPIIFLFEFAKSKRVWPKTSWYFGGISSLSLDNISPVLASNFPGAWYLTWSFSACLSPLPLVVITCKNLGPSIDFSLFNSELSALRSCPSTGPKYSKLRASNMLSCFWVPFFTLVRYCFSAPTLGSIPIALSFKITNKFAVVTPAWFSPSKAIPLAIEASPITATCSLSSPFNWEAIAIPKAAEMEVDECPVPKVSYSLSSLFGNPLMPLNCLFVWNSDFRPVRILCP